MTPEEAYDSVKKLYKDLIKGGWTLRDIDEMDIHFFFELYQEEAKPEAFADEIQW